MGIAHGCHVVYVCDSDPLALETHRLNHPPTEHQCLELPAREAVTVARLPTDGRCFHVHCSPPCVKLSRINHANVAMVNRGAQGHDCAVDMVEWSLEMMLASQCTSWSLEQVHEPQVVEIVERVRLRHPGRVAVGLSTATKRPRVDDFTAVTPSETLRLGSAARRDA